jgi:hypothetical protein
MIQDMTQREWAKVIYYNVAQTQTVAVTKNTPPAPGGVLISIVVLAGNGL